MYVVFLFQSSCFSASFKNKENCICWLGSGNMRRLMWDRNWMFYMYHIFGIWTNRTKTTQNYVDKLTDLQKKEKSLCPVKFMSHHCAGCSRTHAISIYFLCYNTFSRLQLSDASNQPYYISWFILSLRLRCNIPHDMCLLMRENASQFEDHVVITIYAFGFA